MQQNERVKGHGRDEHIEGEGWTFRKLKGKKRNGDRENGKQKQTDEEREEVERYTAESKKEENITRQTHQFYGGVFSRHSL